MPVTTELARTDSRIGTNAMDAPVASACAREATPGLSNPLPEVLIIGDFPFPSGTAGANFVRGQCRALLHAGFTVGLLPIQGSGPGTEKPDGSHRFRGIPYWPLGPSRRLNGFEKYRYALTQQQDARLDWLSRNSLEGVKAILVYPGCPGAVPFVRALQRVRARHPRIRLFSYVVEWHSIRHFQGPLGLIHAAGLEYLRRVVNPGLDGLLCISTCLQDYYKARGCRTALLPPLLDLSEPAWQTGAPPEPGYPQRPMRLLFSGTAQRDRHDLILRAVKRIRDRGREIVLEYVGSRKEEVAALPGVGTKLIESLGAGVRFHGRLEAAAVSTALRSADFGVLFRDDARWSRACFPSKVPEFLALGVLMLCNLTSDLGRYLTHGHNAVIANELSVDGFTAALEQALKLDAPALASMKNNARRTAELFDASRFADVFRDFLSHRMGEGARQGG